MNLSLDTRTLREAVARLHPLTSGKSLPVLGGIRLIVDCGDNRLLLAATNTDIWHRLAIDIKSQEGDSVPIVLPSKLLHEALSKLPDGTLSIKHDTGTATVILTQGRAILRMGAITDPWPVLPVMEWSKAQMPAELQVKLKRALPFASKEEYRPILQCVHLSDQAIEASDGHSLIRIDSDIQADAMVPVPLAHLAARMEGDLTVRFAQGLAEFSTEAETITGKLIEGTYFDLKKHFKYEAKTTMKVSGYDLLKAAELANLTSTTGRISVKCTHSEATVSGIGAAEHQASDSIGVELDQPIEFGCEARLLERAVKASSRDEMELFFTDSHSFHIEEPQAHIVILLCRIQ